MVNHQYSKHQQVLSHCRWDLQMMHVPAMPRHLIHQKNMVYVNDQQIPTHGNKPNLPATKPQELHVWTKLITKLYMDQTSKFQLKSLATYHCNISHIAFEPHKKKSETTWLKHTTRSFNTFQQKDSWWTSKYWTMKLQLDVKLLLKIR